MRIDAGALRPDRERKGAAVSTGSGDSARSRAMCSPSGAPPGRCKWFQKDAAFDAEIASRFSALWRDAAAGALAGWEAAAGIGALRSSFVLDQFPATCSAAKQMLSRPMRLRAGVAERAIARGFDQKVPASERLFFYLPFEHSESLADQERAVALIGTLGNPDLTRWAELHADVIRRFGRFPHRNSALGRASTREEQRLPRRGRICQVEHRRTRS